MARRPFSSSALAPLPRHYWDLVKDAVPPMHAAGRPFVAGALTFGLFGWQHGWARRTSLVAAGAMAVVFREPHRVAPTLVGAVVAPADGVVVAVDEAVPPEELALGDSPLTRVSIRASVLDPYVLRAPLAGRIAAVAPDGSAIVVETPDDVAVGLVQTAASLVGRISCDVHEGQDVALGGTYALVRFGSRVDVYLPAAVEVRPIVGQRTVGGETVLAVLGGSQAT
jgi:phosphatidylserine decarboxylase